MPKYQVQWKDPDACDENGHYIYEGKSDEEREKLHQLGCDEYLVVEFDTDAMTATVRPGR